MIQHLVDHLDRSVSLRGIEVRPDRRARAPQRLPQHHQFLQVSRYLGMAPLEQLEHSPFAVPSHLLVVGADDTQVKVLRDSHRDVLLSREAFINTSGTGWGDQAAAGQHCLAYPAQRIALVAPVPNVSLRIRCRHRSSLPAVVCTT